MDGFDCIREVTGGSDTTYCIPEGQLMSFIRDGDRYDVHCDALLSIRMVTDENGDIVLRREFGAFGGELAGNFDNVPGGLDYGFVGGAGCRKDPSSGLVYMRARWFDSGLGRFISRDPIGLEGGPNLYAYVDNSPANEIDPLGKVGRVPFNPAPGPSTPKSPLPLPRKPDPTPMPLPKPKPEKPPCSCFLQCMSMLFWEALFPVGGSSCGAGVTLRLLRIVTTRTLIVSLASGYAVLAGLGAAFCKIECENPVFQDKMCPPDPDPVDELMNREL